jgi:predicted amidophosphoribosyltransferase
MAGARNGDAFVGGIWGFLLGPIGIAVAWGMRGRRLDCPKCMELVRLGATICPHCHAPLKQKSEELVLRDEVPKEAAENARSWSHQAPGR